MPDDQWFTLVRFHGDPQHLTGASQARTATEALAQLATWDAAFPDDTTVVFDPANRPLTRAQLAVLAATDAPHTAP